MRTFYIISETEMKEVGMKPPREWETYLLNTCAASLSESGYNHCGKFAEHLAAAPVFQHRLNKKGLVSEEDFEWREEKTGEWDDRSDPPCPYVQLVAIPKEEKTKPNYRKMLDWQSGEPDKDGLYLVEVNLDEENNVGYDLDYYRNGYWGYAQFVNRWLDLSKTPEFGGISRAASSFHYPYPQPKEEKEERTFTEDMISFLKDIANNYDCDIDAHNYGNEETECRCCKARNLLTKYLKQQKHEKRPG